MAAIKPAYQAQQNSINVLLVESRQLVRAGLQRIINDTDAAKVLASVANLNEAIRLTRKQAPDIIIASTFASVVSLLDGVRKLRREFPKIQLLVMASQQDLIIQDRLLHFGVAGCIDDRCEIDELLIAIDTLYQGDRYISDNMAQQLATLRVPGERQPAFDELTHRELQILLLVTQGKNTLDIARELCLTQKTVNTYRGRLLDKLGVQTDVALVHFAIRHGLIHV